MPPDIIILPVIILIASKNFRIYVSQALKNNLWKNRLIFDEDINLVELAFFLFLTGVTKNTILPIIRYVTAYISEW
ncbi:MAG: hypothetical protein D3906_05815 [Candidatus Electrothrix sp. AUS1_2]|nr:hypothetical protein [Candidatus Electrothrix sp. AUS1_2]